MQNDLVLAYMDDIRIPTLFNCGARIGDIGASTLTGGGSWFEIGKIDI